MAAHPRSSRTPPLIFSPPTPSPKAPATLIFLHDYNSNASRFGVSPPDASSLAHHIHLSPSLQHVKIVIPNGLPCVHPATPEKVWYNLEVPFPKPGDAKRAHEEIEYGSSERNEDDMEVTMDYVTSLIEAEMAEGTPASRIVLMGYSQGATIAALFLLTRRLGADLGAVISFAGFAPTPMTSVPRMQKANHLEGRWSKKTILFLLHGGKDRFVPVEIYHVWLKRLEGLSEKGEGIARIEGKVLERMGHRLSLDIWPETRRILEMTVPIPSSKAGLKL